MNDQMAKLKLLQQIPLRRFVKYLDWKSLDSSLNQTYYMHVVLQDDSVLKIQEHSSESLIRKVNLDLEDYAVKQGWIKEVSPYFSFSKALELLKQGDKITRKGWNGANQWLSISCPDTKDVVADNFWSPHNAEFARQNGGSAKVAPCITLKNAQGMIIMGWIPSAGDLFADDWMIAE